MFVYKVKSGCGMLYSSEASELTNLEDVFSLSVIRERGKIQACGRRNTDSDQCFSNIVCTNCLRIFLSEVTQSCPTLCDPTDYSPLGSSIHGIFQARVLEWVAISFSRGSSQPRDRTWVSRIVGRCFTIGATIMARRILCLGLKLLELEATRFVFALL